MFGRLKKRVGKRQRALVYVIESTSFVVGNGSWEMCPERG